VGVDPSRLPVKITSDRMTYDEAGKVISFVGHVVANHGELTLWADKLSAFLASSTDKKFAADSVDRIVAEGNVRAKKGTTEGTCGLLTYMVGPQLLKMERDPKLQDGPNSLTGEVINFHIKDDRSEVIGGKQRVKAVFMTPGNLKVQ
jgi:lipopolysaccharide export system protein LptA